jgi:hypothetical protein
MPLRPESALELNRKVAENFLRFLMVTQMPQFDYQEL